MGDRVCLRCDWTGRTDGEACPRCGAALYRIPESTKPRKVTPPPHPQPPPASEPMPSSPIEMAQDDESVLPAVPVAASRRWWAIAGGAFAVAAVWVVATGGPFARTDATIAPAVATTPANKPTANPADTAKEVALGFLDAYAAFDAQKAMSYVADDADLTGFIDPQVPADTEGLSLMLSMFEAWGYKLILTSCETVAHESDTSVVCESVFHALGSDQIGRGPFSNSSFVITVRDGAIIRAWVSKPPEKFDRQMWEPFAEWVSSTYPRDAAVMYVKGTLEPLFSLESIPTLEPRFSLESIRLWERHTREYVETRSAETGPAETAPPTAPAPAEPNVVKTKMCSDGARRRLELTDTGDRVKVRFEVHQSPVGHSWRIHLRHIEHNITTGYGRTFFRGTRVASDSGVFVVQLSRPDWGSVHPDGLVGEAVDSQTGEVCKANAWYR